MKNFDAFKEQGDVIWNIANLLRGPYRPPQYRRVMIPLTLLRRLDCVLEEQKGKAIAEHKKLKADGKYDAETIDLVHCHRTDRRRNSAPAAECRTSSPRGRHLYCAAMRLQSGGRAPRRHHPSGHQAGEHHAPPGRTREN